MRTITVKGTGNVSARPDYIILSLNIEVLSETYDRAMSEAAERIERLQGAAVRVGYRKEDLKTTSFDVQTRYENVKDRQGNFYSGRNVDGQQILFWIQYIGGTEKAQKSRAVLHE